MRVVAEVGLRLLKQAEDDFQRYQGRVVLSHWVFGYQKGTDDTKDFWFDPPVHVLITYASPDDLDHWNDEYLDPYWNVEILDPTDISIENAWIYGITYNGVTGERVEDSSWRDSSTDGHENCLICAAY